MRGGAVYEEKGQLHQVGGGVGKLNIRAWTSSDAAVLREVPSVLCVGFGDGVDFSLQTNVKAAAIALEVISSPEFYLANRRMSGRLMTKIQKKAASLGYQPCGNQISGAPRHCVCAMALSLHAIDAELPA